MCWPFFSLFQSWGALVYLVARFLSMEEVPGSKPGSSNFFFLSVLFNIIFHGSSCRLAQQDAKRAEFLVQKAVQDKESAIIRAKGEAESIRLIGKVLNLHSFLFSH